MTSDITDYFDDAGHLLNLKELSEDMRACIASVKMEEGEISEIKLRPKPHAIHLAATHLRLLAELREQADVPRGADPADDHRAAAAIRNRIARQGALDAAHANKRDGR
jgi:hypothetical protein